MKRLLVTLFLAVPGLAFADVSREQAREIMLALSGPSGARPFAVFLSADPLPSGTVVAPFVGDHEETLMSGTWFGWIDDHPFAFFAHPTRFVYIDAANGTTRVVAHEWWPEVDGVFPFSEEAIELDAELVIISVRRLTDPTE